MAKMEDLGWCIEQTTVLPSRVRSFRVCITWGGKELALVNKIAAGNA
jgi:hypothetical protein